MVDILEDVRELADLICQSDEGKKYLTSRDEMVQDIEIMKVLQKFERVKEEYEEAQRFGIFHPNYQGAKEKAYLFQEEMYEKYPLIRTFLEAEENLDELLYNVSTLLAHAVSQSVLVPNSRWNKAKKGCKCK